MAGYILILAILILGGAIATVGDRLGSQVGRARLRLFNLRPRDTAVVVTVLTGSLISFLTLAILFATSDQLRDGVFRIESIQRQRRQAEADLAEALTEQTQIQGELSKARTELTSAQARLGKINQSLKAAIARQNRTQAQLEKAQVGLKKFSQQATRLRSEINRLLTEARQLQAERQRLIGQRNQAQARFGQAARQRDQLERSVTQAQGRLQQAERQREQLEGAVAQAQARLQQAEQQQTQLEQEVAQAQSNLKQAEQQQAQLEQEVAQAQSNLQQANVQRAQLLSQQGKLEAEVAALESNRDRLEQNVRALLLGLRRGNIAIRAGQVLANGVVRDINNRPAATQAIEQLLREARRTATGLTKPALGPNQQVVNLTKTDFEQLIRQTSDGRAYAVRLLAVVNYFEGEDKILVIPEVAPNQLVFPRGEQVASVEVNPTEMTDDQILQQLDYLFVVTNRRAVESGILRDPLTGTVGSFRQSDLIKFILQLKRYNGTINVAAVAPETIYTSGPLKLELVALQNQQVIFRSQSAL